MSKSYELTWPAHPNIYSGASRELTIYFSEPEHGVNEETGLALLIPGFGGNSRSNVYKKMRAHFADQYNLIVVQCDYFGQEFMQSSESISFQLKKEALKKIFTPAEVEQIYTTKSGDPNTFIKVASRYPIKVVAKEALKETDDNFSDMGIMQALDNLTAVYYVMRIIEDNKLNFNRNKMILFGQSHGSYLSYLCNAMAPHLFSLLIDNSSWIFPAYLKSSRYLNMSIGKMNLQVEFDYLASKKEYDKEFLNLFTLYRSVENECKIECFHGTTDHLITHIDKQRFCESINHCNYHEISSDKVDGTIFKSTNHGLDADFLQLFDLVVGNHAFEERKVSNPKYIKFKTKKANYVIDYTNELPVLTVS